MKLQLIVFGLGLLVLIATLVYEISHKRQPIPLAIALFGFALALVGFIYTLVRAKGEFK